MAKLGFVSGFAKIAAPLNQSLKKVEPVEFEVDEKEHEPVDKRKR